MDDTLSVVKKNNLFPMDGGLEKGMLCLVKVHEARIVEISKSQMLLTYSTLKIKCSYGPVRASGIMKFCRGYRRIEKSRKKPYIKINLYTIYL